MTDRPGSPARRTKRGRPVSGILLLDKPAGCTSNFALQRVKRLYDAVKAGHTGTLDPLATGMLPICLGEATKVTAFLLGSDKEYRVRMAIGAGTASGDAEGPVTVTGPDRLTREALEASLEACRGSLLQVPPMYSALKHEGRRLYELARTGIDVPRPARQVEVRQLEIEEFSPSAPILRVRCSKGTYIRTLVEEIARAAGTVAHVAELRRLAVAPFQAGDMVALDVIEHFVRVGDGAAIEGLLRPLDEALPELPRVVLDGPDAGRLRHGQAVACPTDVRDPGLVRLYDAAGGFLGIGECLPGSRLVPRRLVATPAGL